MGSKKKFKGWSTSNRYYRVDIRVDADAVRSLPPEKLLFLVSCPALVRIDFDPWSAESRGSCEICFRDLEKPKCLAVIGAVGLEVQGARGRMW